jgi:probable F420-dependent oxidoreductase
MKLGRVGIWSAALRAHTDPAVSDAAAELEQLGYGTLWFPAGRGARAFEVASTLLGATHQVTVASGIVSIWDTSVAQAEAGSATLDREAPGRFLLGLGVSHAPLVDRHEQGRYQNPLRAMTDYLDELTGVAADRRIVAALGPKMLALAVTESIGTHPYLVTPEITAALRGGAGDAVVAVEQAVVLETDPVRARAAARDFLAPYLRLPNYVNSWLRNGYGDADVTDGGSDRLVDDLIAWGSLDRIATRVEEHIDAGADHVCLQTLSHGNGLPLAEWRLLAEATINGRAS